ncbi:MAG: hypothetical protein WA803_16345, partial [Steroidobacteraceae bacterium]
MSAFKGIPIQPQHKPTRSGEKYTTAQGFTAIKDGVKLKAADTARTAGDAAPAVADTAPAAGDAAQRSAEPA